MPRLSVSQIEMIQLHLLDMEPFRGELEVPKEACQEGISERMVSGVHNISRALSVLTAEGLVESRLCHIRGASKRRKAYFLTEKGIHNARSLVEDIENRIISFDDSRSIRTVTLAMAMKSFEDRTGKVTASRGPRHGRRPHSAEPSWHAEQHEHKKQTSSTPSRHHAHWLALLQFRHPGYGQGRGLPAPARSFRAS